MAGTKGIGAYRANRGAIFHWDDSLDAKLGERAERVAHNAVIAVNADVDSSHRLDAVERIANIVGVDARTIAARLQRHDDELTWFAQLSR